MNKGDKEFNITKLASNGSIKLDCIDELTRIAPEKHRGCFVGVGHT